jgi:hypothetical protein
VVGSWKRLLTQKNNCSDCKHPAQKHAGCDGLTLLNCKSPVHRVLPDRARVPSSQAGDRLAQKTSVQSRCGGVKRSGRAAHTLRATAHSPVPLRATAFSTALRPPPLRPRARIRPRYAPARVCAPARYARSGKVRRTDRKPANGHGLAIRNTHAPPGVRHGARQPLAWHWNTTIPVGRTRSCAARGSTTHA